MWVSLIYFEETEIALLGFLLKELNRPQEKIRVDKLSRHLYDIHEFLR
jgi:hypothetical protein